MLKYNKGVLKKWTTRVYIFIPRSGLYDDLYVIPSHLISTRRYLDHQRNRFPDTEANIRCTNTTMYLQLK